MYYPLATALPIKLNKMNNKTFTVKKILILCFLIVLNHGIYAQSKPLEITIQGNLMDSISKNPIAFATINVLDSSEQVIKIALSNTDGTINFTTNSAPNYHLYIVATGHQAKRVLLKSNTNKTLLNLETILLAPKTNELEEIVISAKTPIIKQEVDRIVYNLQADPESRVKNTLEIMRKMPYLSMDAEENILLKGNKDYKIFINGKPSGLMENNPKEVLRTMPASTIQRIEIITNPSSKYDAEGVTGIINIVTLKKMGDGFNGNINTYHSFPTPNSGIGTSFTTKSGKWGLSSYAGVNYNEMLPTNYSNNQVATNSILLQNGQKKSHTKSAYLGVNLSFELDSLNLITAQGSTNLANNTANDFQTTLINTNGTNNQQYKTNNDNNGKNNGFDAGINWQIGSKKNKSRLITLSYQYLSYQNKRNTVVDVLDKINFLSPNFKQYNKANNSEHTFQTDFVQAFKSVYVEAGVKGILRNNNSNFEFLKQNTISSIFEKDSLGSNQFLSTQNIVGAYNNYRFNVKTWSFQTGFRLEQTLIDAEFLNNATPVHQNYFNIIPSISINKELKNKANLNFGFSQRIKRPGITRLNPFVDRSNPNFETTGNPKLQPVLNNDIMIGYSFSKKVSYNIGVGYSFTNNIDLKVATYNSATKITKTIFENTGSASRLGIDYNVNYPANDKFNLGINGNFAYFWIGGFADNKPIKNNLFTYNFIVNTSYQFKNNWQAFAEVNVLSQNPAGLQSKTNGFVRSSFSISKSVLNNKLSFSAYANNVFSKYRDNKTSSFGYNFEQTNIVNEYFRVVGFSINYKFGKLDEELKNNKRQIRNDDVSN